MADEIEITVEKSQEIASYITGMKVWLQLVDDKYMNAVAKELKKKASFIDSAAVLDRNYSPKKTELLRAQASVAATISLLITEMKLVDNLKAQLEQESKTMDNLSKMFL